MNDEIKMNQFIIEFYGSGKNLILKHPESMTNCHEIYKFNGFQVVDLLTDFCIPDDMIDFELMIHNERKEYILSFSNFDGEIFSFYCSSQFSMLQCMKEMSQVILNIYNIQKIIKDIQNAMD